MSSEEINYWLREISKWQKQRLSLDLILEQIKSIEDLTILMSKIEDRLNELGSVGNALSQVPQVGQLLGRLTTVVTMACDVNAYNALISCLMFFFVDEPATPVEVRAKNWVVSQVRSSVCLSRNLQPLPSQSNPGYQQIQMTSESLKRVFHQVKEHLASGLESASRDEVLGLCRICLWLSHVSYFSGTVENIITFVGEIDTDERQEMLKMITDFCKEKKQLPYECQLVLWKTYLPSLEHDVLLLCDSIFKKVPSSFLCMEQMMNSSPLVQACSDNFSVYENVFAMLTCLRSETGDSSTYDHIISTLHGSIRKYRLKNSAKVHFSLKKLYPQKYHPVLTVMSTSPTELTLITCEHQFEQLDQALRACHPPLERDEHDVGVPQNILLQYQDWYHAALLLALLGSKQISTACCNVIMEFKVAKGISCRKNLEYLKGVVDALRPLMTKTSLEWEDVQCAIASSDDFKGNWIGDLLMVFITHSMGGYNVASKVLEMGLNWTDSTDMMTYILPTLCIVAPLWRVKLTPLKIPNLIRCLEEIQLSVKQEADRTQSDMETSDLASGDNNSIVEVQNTVVMLIELLESFQN